MVGYPTPEGVPVDITSPTSRVMIDERYSTISGILNMSSLVVESCLTSPFSVRETLGDILRSQSFEIHEAANGAEAYERVEQTEFDCVIVDLRLPDVTGLDIIEKISGKIKKRKIIIVTGYASSEVLSTALTDAEHFLLLKPVDPEQLISVVRKITKEK